jgi:hypothetical protein
MLHGSPSPRPFFSEETFEAIDLALDLENDVILFSKPAVYSVAVAVLPGTVPFVIQIPTAGQVWSRLVARASGTAPLPVDQGEDAPQTNVRGSIPIRSGFHSYSRPTPSAGETG